MAKLHAVIFPRKRQARAVVGHLRALRLGSAHPLPLGVLSDGVAFQPAGIPLEETSFRATSFGEMSFGETSFGETLFGDATQMTSPTMDEGRA